MKVNGIGNPQNFGMAFRVNRMGAYRLAQDFVDNPKLEEKFMNKIVAPLEKADADVVYNGYAAMFKHNADDYYSGIVLASDREAVVVPYQGPLAYSRNVYRPHDNLKFQYTNDFFDKSATETAFADIEAAKSIALNISAERSGKSINEYTTKDYKAPDLGKTLEEKMQNLYKLFGLAE